MPILIYLVLCLTAIPVFGQDLDTLDGYFNKIENDSARVIELAKYSHRLARKDPDFAIQLGRRAMAEAKEHDLSLEKGIVHNSIGYAYITKAQTDTAEWHYLEAIKIFEKENDRKRLAEAYNNIGYLVRRKGDYDRAGEYLFKSLRIKEELEDSSGIAKAYVNIGIFYSIQGNYEKSIRHYRKAVELQQLLGNENKLGNAYNNLGIDYELKGKIDSSKYFYFKSLAIRQANEEWVDVAESFNNMAIFYRKLEQYDSAILLAQQGAKIGADLGLTNDLAQSYHIIGSVHFEMDNIQNAEQYFLKSLEATLETTSIRRRATIYDALRRLYEKKGDYKSAYNYFTEYQIFEDSMSQTANVKVIAEAEEKYEAEKKDKQITQLELEQQTSKLLLAKSENQRNIFIASTLVVVVAAVLLFILFRQKRKSLAERDILLKEIHHRVKNNLQVISSLLNLQAGSLSDDVAKDAVREGQSRVKSMALIHQKLYSTDDVRGVDVQDYLENLSTELFKAFGVDEERVNWNIDASGLKMDIDTVIPLGLIINELITNSIKYAFQNIENGLLEISLKENGPNLNVVVKDNGIGMDEDALKTTNSFGWKMIKSLSRKLKAEITVDGVSGTNVTLAISRYKLVV